MPPETVERLSSWERLWEVSGHDPFVRYDVGPAFAAGWAVEGAVAFVRRTPSRRTVLALMGTGGGVEDLLGCVASRPHLMADLDITVVSVPQPLEPLVHRHFRVGPGSDWEWLWTTTAPPTRPAEAALTALDNVADADELSALLGDVSPSASARPGQPGIEQWVGVRDGSGTLVACGAMQRTAGGSPHLASIAVRPDRRGEGLGAAVTTWLTRQAVAAEGVCTLGLYSHNTVARSLYVGLGYRRDHLWATRVVTPLP